MAIIVGGEIFGPQAADLGVAWPPVTKPATKGEESRGPASETQESHGTVQHHPKEKESSGIYNRGKGSFGGRESLRCSGTILYRRINVSLLRDQLNISDHAITILPLTHVCSVTIAVSQKWEKLFR